MGKRQRTIVKGQKKGVGKGWEKGGQGLKSGKKGGEELKGWKKGEGKSWEKGEGKH